ncbi:glycosyltransferase [Dysgonomonas sp. Marseille-P4677]|uniref:glycosyltransferase family 2 protein n=1 Tax=Dysgonomonas sp. Marseille-P4677 TaxID=2364790 RepID=UPI001913A855|nr:glycosyltransferase family 2 protein [Dysgonomonas sp. Marseille-P4677]MBK5721752.1 glycosyltransferase [Dysgonomonas sp. Marseille-P4677]
MKLSIITINFNNASGLQKTINSVLSQTYKNYEYIVIDGGSTDGSKELIESYSDKIDYWVSEPDKGIYNAMNKGIRQAKGEYLHFLNSGDIYANNYVLQEVFEQKTYESPILRGIQICDNKGCQTKWINRGNRDITLYDLYIDTLQHQATFIHQDLFKKYGLYDEKYKIVSDWIFFLKAMLGGESSTYLNFDIVIFDMTGISNNAEFRKTMFNERKQIISELIPRTVQTDYERLTLLQKHTDKYGQYFYMIDFINNNKVPRFCFRLLNKLYKVLKLQ